jgi:uncharacterized protein (DUF1501 family)
MLSRRQFLERSSLVSLSPLVPCVFSRLAQAAPAEADAKILVVIQLDGGNDGLNTVVPFADDAYNRARETLRLTVGDLHKLNDRVALHPQMRAAKELFDDGRLTIVQGVGYPNPDRSHFRSMKIWQTARFDDQTHDEAGWLGRAMDEYTASQSVVATSREPSAIYVGAGDMPVALWGRRSLSAALDRADELALSGSVTQLSGFSAMRALASEDGEEGSGDAQTASLSQFVERQMLTAYTTAARFRSETRRVAAASYPNNQLADRLRLVSQLVQSDSAARVYYTTQNGYDTHAAQLYTHADLLREFSSAVKAFLDDMKATGLDERVLVLAFSEFGRRVEENDSHGTDHGTSGPVFLAGTPVRGGLVGQAPNLNDLAEGDIKMQYDFRQVYATLLNDWLGVNASSTLGGDFTPLTIL